MIHELIQHNRKPIPNIHIYRNPHVSGVGGLVVLIALIVVCVCVVVRRRHANGFGTVTDYEMRDEPIKASTLIIMPPPPRDEGDSIKSASGLSTSTSTSLPQGFGFCVICDLESDFLFVSQSNEYFQNLKSPLSLSLSLFLVLRLSNLSFGRRIRQ